MRSAVRPIHYNKVPDLVNAAKEMAKEHHRFQDSFEHIVSSAFGDEQNKGVIPSRIDYYYQKTPINWAEELESLTRIFAPAGDIMAGQGMHGLIPTADHLKPIDPKILPKSVLEEFAGSGDRHSTMLPSLKRQLGDKYYIHGWEWFWANLAHALVNHPQIDEKRSMLEDEQEDELYFMLSRNPYLIIARRALQYVYHKDIFLLERMRGVFELYVIQDLLFATKKKEGYSGKYQLRSQHLGMMFLLIHSRRGKLTGQTMEIYQEYFLKATEYYSTITEQTNTKNVRNLLRMWIYLLTREHTLDSSLVKQVENANPKDGWYRLSRCPLQEWAKAIKRVELYSYELPSIINVRRNFYRLLGKKNEWEPNFAMMSVLEQLLEFDEGVLYKYMRRQSDKEEEDETVARCFSRILIHLAENGAKCEILQGYQDKINLKHKSKLNKKLEINFAERSSSAKQNLSRTSRERLKTISSQSPRIRNVWEHPLQENQFYIFFQLALWMSKQLDKGIPGHSQRVYPCVNIRIISNPFIFFFILFVMMLAVKMIFDI